MRNFIKIVEGSFDDEYYPDFNNEEVYDSYIEQVEDEFDFDRFMKYCSVVIWPDDGSLTEEDKAIHADELVGELASYLEKELTDIDSAYMNEDMSEEAERLFQKEVKPKLLAAGYTFIGEENKVIDEAEGDGMLRLQYLATDKTRLWKNSYTKHKSPTSIQFMVRDAIDLKNQEGWYSWRIIDDATGDVIESEQKAVRQPDTEFEVKILNAHSIPRILAAKASVKHDFDMLGAWDMKLEQIIRIDANNLKDHMIKHGGSSGIVYLDEKTGEIAPVSDEHLRLGDHYEDGDVSGIVVATITKQ